MYERRERGKNFSDRDKYILLALVEGHMRVIENKKTDNLSTLQKKKTWQEIEEKFNLRTQNDYRKWDRLKNLYENLKSTARSRKKAAEQGEISETEAGAAKTTLNAIDNKILSLLHRHSISNNFDERQGTSEDLSSFPSGSDCNDVKTEPSQSTPESPEFYCDPFHMISGEEFLAENDSSQINQEPRDEELSETQGENPDLNLPLLGTSAKKRKQQPTNSKEKYYNRLMEMAEEKHGTEMEILKLVKRKEELEVLIKTNQAQKDGLL